MFSKVLVFAVVAFALPACRTTLEDKTPQVSAEASESAQYEAFTFADDSDLSWNKAKTVPFGKRYYSGNSAEKKSPHRTHEAVVPEDLSLTQ